MTPMTLADITVPVVYPFWAEVFVFIAVPCATLIVAVTGLLSLFRKVTNLEVKVNGRLNELLAAKDAETLARESSTFERGIVEGRLRAETAARQTAERLLIEEGLKAQGAKALLEAQATPPAVIVIPPTVFGATESKASM